MSIVLDPMNEHSYSITDVVRISLWLNLHLDFRCDIVDFRHIVNVIVSRFTSHFIYFIFLGVSYSHPEHGVFDSFELRNVPHVEIDDSWRLV
jgi:hypothetical protein